MATRPATDPLLDLARSRQQQQQKAPRARLRIMIASDPTRPVRTITLPRALPKVLVVGTLTLVAGAADVAVDLTGDDDVGAAHAAAHDAALADHHRPPRIDGALDGAVDAEGALRAEIAADHA